MEVGQGQANYIERINFRVFTPYSFALWPIMYLLPGLIAYNNTAEW